MTQLGEATYRQLLEEYLERHGSAELLHDTPTLPAVKKNRSPNQLPRLVRRRFKRYLSRIEHVLRPADKRTYWIPGRQTPRLDLAGPPPPTSGELDVAVHLHVYYLDLLPELLAATHNVGQPFTCYVTTDSRAKASAAASLLGEHPLTKGFEVLVTPNRGRDIGPWIVGLSDYHDRHDLWCHLHTKKSLHRPQLGEDWRHFLLQQLVGSEASVRHILAAFETDPGLGLVIPPFYYYAATREFTEWEDPARASRFFHRLGIDLKLPGTPLFSAGSMCWYRPRALRRLFEQGFRVEDFEVESGQVDTTLMHLIERSLVYVTQAEGMGYRVLVPA